MVYHIQGFKVADILSLVMAVVVWREGARGRDTLDIVELVTFVFSFWQRAYLIIEATYLRKADFLRHLLGEEF